MIYEVHRKVKNNVGDLYCNPSRYFNIECASGELMYNDYPIEDNHLIVGGGGLIHKKFSKHIQMLTQKNPATTTLWAIGHNFSTRHVQKEKGDVYYPKWIEDCNLVGIRDWIEDYEKYYLPCVTCMHPAFEKQYSERHEVVYFTHAFKSKFTNPDNHPYIKNNIINFEKIISFLGSARNIVTDSYHGAYWAQLLGKNVQVLSWSVKFDHMKYQPHFIQSINEPFKKTNNSVDGFLDECKDYNVKFYQKFLDLLN